MERLKQPNNLEALRLFFALQVMFIHLTESLPSKLTCFVGHFPGVPAFFFISGLLIYASYSNSKSLRSYVENRFLRIFPALLFVTVGGVVLILLAKGLGFFIENPKVILSWVALQLTIGQGYNPGAFADIGVGAINGVLWTITVEILFYVSVPVIKYLEKYSKFFLYVFFFVSFLVYAIGEKYLSVPIALGKNIYDFLNLTPIIWGWMFILGIFTYKNLGFICRHSRWFCFAIIPMLAIIISGSDNVIFRSHGNHLGLAYMVLYCALIIYVAFEIKPVKIKFDISYGVYIWHMVVLNFAITLGLDSAFFVFLVTILIALLSWYLIEKPSLKLKKTSLLRRDSAFSPSNTKI